MTDLRINCEEGLRAIDAVLSASSPVHADLSRATRCADDVREFLMAQTRAGNVLAETLVPRANDIVADLDAVEIPLSSAARQRIAKARDSFASLAGDALRVSGRR